MDNNINPSSSEDREFRCVAAGVSGDVSLDICAPYNPEWKFYLLTVEAPTISLYCTCDLDYLFNRLIPGLDSAINSQTCISISIGQFHGADVFLILHDEHITQHYLRISSKCDYAFPVTHSVFVKLTEQFPKDFHNALLSAKEQYDTYGD